MSSNNLAGGDLTQATQHFLHLTHLTDLFLQHNQIHGTLPTALVHHPTLVRLDLSHNQLQGHVPSEYVTAEQTIAYEDEDEAAQEMDLSTETNIYDLIVALRSKTPHVYDTAQVYFPHNTTPTASPSSPSSRHTALHHHPFFSATNGAQEDQPQRFLQQYLLHREWEPATASATKPVSTTTTTNTTNTTTKVFKQLNWTGNHRLSKFYRGTASTTAQLSTTEQQRIRQTIHDSTIVMTDPNASFPPVSGAPSSSPPPHLPCHAHLPAPALTHVYVRRGVLTFNECQEIIAHVEESRQGWQTDRHKVYKTVDVDVRHVPWVLQRCNACLSNNTGILQTLSHCFQVKLEDLVVEDLFVVKYSCGDTVVNQTSLPPHQDDSVISFVLSLNNHGTDKDTEYLGGGTEFINWKHKHMSGHGGDGSSSSSSSSGSSNGCSSDKSGVAFKTSQPEEAGTMTSFCGLQLHAGKQIHQGVRYILTGFLKVKDVNNETRKQGERWYPYPHGRFGGE